MKKTITREEAIKAIVNYFNENESEFNTLIETADSYDGYLGDNRYYPMEDINEIYRDTDADEILTRAFYGHDEDCYTTDSHGERHYDAFNPNRDYFGYNGYGNLISTDYPDYSYYNDDYFAEKINKFISSHYTTEG